MLPPSPTAASRHNGPRLQDHSVGVRDSGEASSSPTTEQLVRRQAASAGFAIVGRGSVPSDTGERLEIVDMLRVRLAEDRQQASVNRHGARIG